MQFDYGGYPEVRIARHPAPRYRDEGPHALWHFSENPGIEVFHPHRAATSDRQHDLVWAVDTRHAPMFSFPRDCPRGCAWPTPNTTETDKWLFFGHTAAPRIHVIEGAWLARMRSVRLFAYRLPDAGCGPDPIVGGYWIARAAVEPIERVALGDLLALHANSGIELRVAPSIWPWWAEVIRSSLEYSGSRLRNCTVPKPAEDGGSDAVVTERPFAKSR